MFKAIQTGVGMLAGNLLYNLFSAAPDWPRALVIGLFGFLAHALFLVFRSRFPTHQRN